MTSSRRLPPEPLAPERLLHELVAIPSLSGAEGRAATHLVERLRPYADAAFLDRAGNAVARFGRGDRRVVVLGHVDTVPGEVPVRVEGDLLYGRGSVDAKGPLVAAGCAAAQLDDATRQRLTVDVIGAVGEEAEESVGARHAVREHPAPDLLIVAEPSGWDRFTVAYKGRLRFQLRCEREHGHSAGPAGSASEEVVEAYLACREWARRAAAPTPPFGAVQIGLTSIEGGDDGLRQSARAVVSLRLPPAWPPDAVEAALREAVSPGVELRRTSAEQAVRADRDTPLARAFRAAIRAQGGRPRPVLKTGTSDVNVVHGSWPVAWLAYGPGDSVLDHTPHEHVSLSELRRATAVLGDALRRVAERGAPGAGAATGRTARSSSG